MEEDGKEYFTDTRTNLYTTNKAESFEDLMEQFNKLVANLIDSYGENFEKIYQPKIVHITEKYLGKGQKVSQISPDQTEALSLIVDELKDLI